MSYFQRIRSRYFLVFGHTRILLMSRKYSGLHKMHSQDGEWHVHGEEMRRRAFARGNYERKVTDLWQILRQHSIQVDFRLFIESDFRSSPRKDNLTRELQTTSVT